jgi:TM2 domain-containing membrane protein YozV
LFSLILSFLIPGLGQIYNGEGGKGIVLIVAAIISVILIGVCISIITYPAVWIYARYDAYVMPNG